jgi:hypothetical protein
VNLQQTQNPRVFLQYDHIYNNVFNYRYENGYPKMATATLARHIGRAAREKWPSGGGWYGPHMAAASRAIAERLPLVDLVLEIRDARVGLPLPSVFFYFTNCSMKCLTHVYEIMFVTF